MKSLAFISLVRAFRSLVTLFDLSGDGPVKRYHPEDHYMRGPGPKWREKRILDRVGRLNVEQRYGRERPVS